jgi:cytochrome c oxidase cbb3-type subunit 3
MVTEMILLTSPAPTDGIAKMEFWQIGLYISIILALLLLITSMYLLKAVNRLAGELNKAGASEEEQQLVEEFKKQSFWSRLFQLKPLSQERNLLIDENYDGIAELNNPTPPWFMWLFYSTIVFAVLYILNYHYLEISPLQGKEYENELVQAEADLQAYMKVAGASIDENSVKLLTDKSSIGRGKKAFTTNCVSCHAPNGEGAAGPNLTDKFWLHGGTVKDIFHTIKEGVPGKAMISWKSRLSPSDMQDIASYILSLEEIHPPQGKAPEGLPLNNHTAMDSNAIDSIKTIDSLPIK